MSAAPAAMTKELVPETSAPAVPISQETVIDLVIVSPPKPPGSRQLISPPAWVFEIAPAKVLHGAVRLHGLASSPTPDTQVRVACAWAGAAQSTGTSIAPSMVSPMAIIRMFNPPFIVTTFKTRLVRIQTSLRAAGC